MGTRHKVAAPEENRKKEKGYSFALFMLSAYIISTMTTKNFLFGLYVTALLPLVASVELAITANRGQLLSADGKAEVHIGQPFSVVVSVRNSSGQLSEPTIAGLKQFVLRG